jgi:hypothetical protein
MHKAGGGSINSCDVVALEYKTGWWFSCSDHDEGSPCKTRTCKPLQDSNGGNWDNWDRRCTWEMFRIRAKGQDCWSPIRDGSVVVLTTTDYLYESWGVVGKRQGWNPIPVRVDDTVRTGKTEPSSRLFCMGRNGCATWRYNYSFEFLLFVKKD